MFEKYPLSLPSTVYIVGCGGTGSRLVPLLAQFLKSLNYIINPKIILMDFDVVEQHNLVRQNFIKPDVGKNKAVVLAERYSRAFDIDIVPFTDKRMTGSLNYYSAMASASVVGYSGSLVSANPIIIMCVDSAKARTQTLQNFYDVTRNYHPFYIDSGNEDGYGQLMLYNAETMIDGPGLEEAMKLLPAFIPSRQKIHTIPCDIRFYAELKDLPGASCATLDQTLAINSLMASSIMGVVQNHYYSKPINYNRVNVTLEGCTYPNILSPKNFAKLSVGSFHVGTADQKRAAQSLSYMGDAWGFRQIRTEDHIIGLATKIKTDEAAAKAALAEAAKKAVQKKPASQAA